MAQIRVSLGFADASDHVLEETAGHVILGYFGEAAATFPNTPLTKAAFQAALTGFSNAIAARAQGGTEATATKTVARDALVTMLRQIALNVQTVIQLLPPAQALETLLSSGLDAVSTSRAQHPLAQPVVYGVENDGTGRLKLRIGPVANARNYAVQYQVAGGAWVGAGLFQSTRGLVVSGLTPGTMYTFQVRAVGGSTGHSDWSDPVSHMSL